MISLADAIVAEEFAGGILRVADAIGMKHDDVARIENEAALVVSGLFEHPQRKTRQPNFFAAAAME